MSVINSIKDAFVGQAMRLAGSPRVSKWMGDPRLMNAAMKAMSVGGAVKSNMDKAGRFAAGVFGLATQDEVAGLRATVQSLEDTIASLESTATQPAAAQPAAAPPKTKRSGPKGNSPGSAGSS